MIRVGLDVGSTTAKMVAVDEADKVVFSQYERHNTQVLEVVLSFLRKLQLVVKEEPVSLRITGSVGMGISERYRFPFVQEVVAATKAIQQDYSSVKTLIDIGGEDAKIVFIENGQATDLRMNGNCAGGTGAFIDQMAIILGVNVNELNDLALRATRIFPIASRCGVFCKTDIQNLIAKKVSRENIAASIFHAVAVQTISTLAHGCDIKKTILFCGGPLTFIPALQQAFKNFLSLHDDDVLLPEHGELMPAKGAALTALDEEKSQSLTDIMKTLGGRLSRAMTSKSLLPPVFKNQAEYVQWKQRISQHQLKKGELQAGRQEAFIGIDSGSTTTKIVVLNEAGDMLFSFYKNNAGAPVETVSEGLLELKKECDRNGTELFFGGSCTTGYGEDLVKVAFGMHAGIIETIAHYMAAKSLNEQVSFILDIGGQDMKAIFVDKGIINRIEINEACSSGCGSFIETFAKSLGYSTVEFARKACNAQLPCDLGTRCTVFMNSKVKQVLREGATIDDISAGLAYSVVKNCLYKVLKLKNVDALGKHIVVQGGTMRNDAVVRALEILTETEVARCDSPELMGAYGCALYAKEHRHRALPLDDMLSNAVYTTRTVNCKGCENNCLVHCCTFADGRHYYFGNRCEKAFSNSGSVRKSGKNMYLVKNDLLFSRQSHVANPKLRIGIPRVLNMFEEYPFWHTLFSECDIEVCLSEPSDFSHYEKCVRMVMSDNICFPAKLVHSHIENLKQQHVDRIFMPFVLFEAKMKNEQNSYNCPIVTGYSVVVKGVQSSAIPIDSPTISFKNKKLLLKQCKAYLETLGIERKKIAVAFEKAEKEQQLFLKKLAEENKKTLETALSRNETIVLLAGRPYHTDPLVQHKVSNMLTEMGVHVLTDDVSRTENVEIDDTHFLSQWAYPNRIMKAAKWCTTQGLSVQFVQMTSFGCGPDAFLCDEVRDLLLRNGKSHTLLKLDDINNIGSMKLRVRSLIESLKLQQEQNKSLMGKKPFQTTPIYDKSYRRRKMLVPYFTSYISPLIPSILRVAGYEVETLPLSDELSCEWGLKFANNEVCYPATLIIGDVIKAFRSGKYNPSECVVAMVQTGGQCRASNYFPMLKKALVDAGYTDVPVVSVTFGENDLKNNQPAFHVNWLKMLPIAVRAVLYSDCISKFYYAAVVREKQKGAAGILRDTYLQKGAELIESGNSSQLYNALACAAAEFDAAVEDRQLPKVGVVGEIFLKFNLFAQRSVTDWLIEQGIEVIPPILMDFFLQSFVNRKAKVGQHVESRRFSDAFMGLGYELVQKQLEKVNKIASAFRYFTPFGDIFGEAEMVEQVIPLNAQFGEGWQLPAEVILHARSGVKHVISLQPFGCIANHIVSKGVEKRIKELFPNVNLLSLDFDSGVSDVNIKNRLLLFIDNLKKDSNEN